MENWIREDIDFFKINCDRYEKVKVITNKSIEEEFFDYANNFKGSAYILAQRCAIFKKN